MCETDAKLETAVQVQEGQLLRREVSPLELFYGYPDKRSPIGISQGGYSRQIVAALVDNSATTISLSANLKRTLPKSLPAIGSSPFADQAATTVSRPPLPGEIPV